MVYTFNQYYSVQRNYLVAERMGSGRWCSGWRGCQSALTPSRQYHSVELWSLSELQPQPPQLVTEGIADDVVTTWGQVVFGRAGLSERSYTNPVHHQNASIRRKHARSWFTLSTNTIPSNKIMWTPSELQPQVTERVAAPTPAIGR